MEIHSNSVAIALIHTSANIKKKMLQLFEKFEQKAANAIQKVEKRIVFRRTRSLLCFLVEALGVETI